MRLNEHSALRSASIILVPYCARHVPVYHAWMKDPELRQATASEPLSIDEEYAMQRSWRADADKLTFIICTADPAIVPSTTTIAAGQFDAAERMIGDINLFLVNDDASGLDKDVDDQEASSLQARCIVGEIELMIARKEYRRQGRGRAALELFLRYILDKQSDILAKYIDGSEFAFDRKLDHLRVKVNESNRASLALFESMGFSKTTEQANYFGELELRVSLTSELLLRSLSTADTPRELIYAAGE